MAAIRFDQAQPKRLAYILLGLSLFSLPFGWGPGSNLLLLLLALISFIALKAQDWKYSLSSPLTLASWFFFLLYLLSLLYSDDLNSGQRELETKLSFFLGPPILVALGRYFSSKEKRNLQIIFILACVGSLISALAYAGFRAWDHQALSYIKPNGSQEHFFFLYETLSEPFMHPGYLSTLFGIAILLLVKNLWVEFLDLKRSISWGLILFLGLGLFLLQGRINILALGIVLGTMTLWRLVKLKRWRWLFGGAGFIAFLILGFLSFAPQSVKERYLAFPDFSYDLSGSNFNSATYRLAEWECAWEAIQQEPWFGYGIGDSKEQLLKTYQEKGFLEGYERRYNAHNQYLETSLATGALGLTSLLVLLAVYTRRAYKLNRQVLLASMLFFCICLLTESMFERAWAIVSFNVFFPFFLSDDKGA